MINNCKTATVYGLVDLVKPEPEQIQLRDISHALARINRFCGATAPVISVAAHSLLVARIASDMSGGHAVVICEALLHDAHEAYIGDIPSPFVSALSMNAFGEIARIKNALDHVIFLKLLGTNYGSVKHHRAVRAADLLALNVERKYGFSDAAERPGLGWLGDGALDSGWCDFLGFLGRLPPANIESRYDYAVRSHTGYGGM